MIKIGGGGAGVVTPLKPPPPILRCFWREPSMTPTTPLQASFTATPPIYPPPLPHKNFDHTLGMSHDLCPKTLYHEILS